MKTLARILILALVVATAVAQVPNILNYQGRVTVGGTNLTTNAALFKFALVNSNGSASFWRNDGATNVGEPSNAVTVATTQGLYATLLGDTTLSNMAAIPATVFTNAKVNLRVWFSAGGTNAFTQLSPDQRLGSSGYAIRAASAETATVTNIAGNLTVGGQITVGGDFVATANTITLSGGLGTNGTNVGLNFKVGYTSNSTPLGTVGATVGGGGGIIGGTSTPNTASGHFSTISGGAGNTASGFLSSIGGGFRNTASGLYSVVSGGRENHAAGSNNSTVGGGQRNQVFGNWATIVGGLSNIASGTCSSIAGGSDNVAGSTNIFFAPSYNAVGGGQSNSAIGNYATIPGGLANTATNSAFAAGTRSLAIHTGAFVWSSVSTVDTASTNTNSFTVRAPGGARFLSTTNTNAFIGVILTNGATAWASLSDSNSKTDFEPVRPREILSKIAALPVTSWHYKHDLHRRYIGPMAQDFHAAFGLGSDDKTISTLDSDGVMYAAIQGLVEELRDRDKAIEELKAELRALREQVDSTLPPAN